MKKSIIILILFLLFGIHSNAQPYDLPIYRVENYPHDTAGRVTFYMEDLGSSGVNSIRASIIGFKDTSEIEMFSDTVRMKSLGNSFIVPPSGNFIWADNYGNMFKSNFEDLYINYSNITGAPSIPAAQVNSDWNAVSGVQQILNKPSLFSGSYGDLTGVPSTFTPSSHTHAFSDLTSKPTSLSGYGITDPVVLTSGSYNNPSWLTGLAYSKLSGVPSTFTPASHTHAWTDITGAPSFITGNQSITISGDISGTGTTSISTSISNNTITSAKIVDGSITASDLNSMSATNGQVLKYNGTAWAPATDATGSAPGTDKAAVYSIGTPYNITTTPAKVDFTGASSVDPSVVIPAPGTYVIMSNVRIDYAGLTNVAANTVSVKLRRTNNTATDIANATGDFTVPPVTLLTSTGGDCDISTVFYTTTNSNDIIEIWASRSASISVGNIVAGNAWIVAYRIY